MVVVELIIIRVELYNLIVMLAKFTSTAVALITVQFLERFAPEISVGLTKLIVGFTKIVVIFQC